LLADRFGRRKQLVVGALLLDALCFWALTAPVDFAVFMALRFVEGAAHIFALSLLLAIASQSVDDARRGRVMGLVGAGIMLGVALGAPLGGVLGRSGPLLPLQYGAALALAAAGLAAVVLRDRPVRAAAAERRPGLGEIAAAVRSSPALAIPLVFAFADRFTVGFFTTTFSLFLRGIHELSPAAIGMLIGVFMIPFALLSFPFGMLSERWSRVWMMCGGSAIYGALLACLGWWPPDHLVLLMLALGVFAAVMFVPSMLMTVDLTPSSIRTTAMGAFNAAGSLGFIVGPITGGFVTQTVAEQSGWLAGYRAAFVVAGLSQLVCVASTLPHLLRLVREKRTT
jgi:MFS family permease